MQSSSAVTRTASLKLIVLALFVLPVVSHAAGARQGVKARPGEIVLLRDVSTRPAYRPAPPGLALIANPSPKGELASVLGTQAGTGLDELSDEDYAAMDGGRQVASAQTTTVESVVDRAIGGAVGNTLGRGGVISGQGINQALGVPMGAVGNATRGIGSQITSALSQFPLTQPPGGN